MICKIVLARLRRKKEVTQSNREGSAQGRQHLNQLVLQYTSYTIASGNHAERGVTAPGCCC